MEICMTVLTRLEEKKVTKGILCIWTMCVLMVNINTREDFEIPYLKYTEKDYRMMC